MQKQRAVFAFDCEGCGPNHISHGLKSIGWVLGQFGEDGQAGIIQKGRIDFLPMQHQHVDLETLTNFYHKGNPGLWEILSQNARPAVDAIATFNALLIAFDSTYDLYLLTDTASYDPSLINYYLQLHGYLPLHFARRLGGEFRPVHDADSYARGFLKRGPGEMWVSNSELIKAFGLHVPGNLRAHLPEDDAEGIYWCHVGLVNHANGREVKF